MKYFLFLLIIFFSDISVASRCGFSVTIKNHLQTEKTVKLYARVVYSYEDGTTRIDKNANLTLPIKVPANSVDKYPLIYSCMPQNALSETFSYRVKGSFKIRKIENDFIEIM